MKAELPICLQCGLNRVNWRGKKFCSPSCAAIHNNAPRILPKAERVCGECGNTFYFETWKLKWMKMLYCSRKCANRTTMRNRTGSKSSAETIKKLRKSHMGQVAWNKGKVGVMPIPWNKGKISPLRGEKHPMWQGGKTSESERLRKQVEYVQWRIDVFTRDGRTCVWCGSKTRIEADHIKPWALYPELRLDINNGRTLCHDCHTTTPTYLNSKIKTREQFEALTA